MSAPDDKAPKVKWETIEKVAAQAELDRWSTMSDEEVEVALKEMGAEIGAVEEGARRVGAGAGAVSGAGAKPVAVASVSSLAEARERRVQWRSGAIALAAAAAVAIFGYAKRETVSAWLYGEQPGPDNGGMIPPPTPQERAAAATKAQIASLLDEARKECEASKISECEHSLNAVEDLDPTLVDNPEVIAMRYTIQLQKGKKPPMR